MKKPVKIGLSLFVALTVLFQSGAKASPQEPRTLLKPETEVRMSTALEGELAGSLELAGVTVLPLVKSGNIAYESSDRCSKKTDIGSLLHIYIRNKTDREISPQVTFNGMTASALLDRADNTVSWASTPDTRANRKYDIDRVPGGDSDLGDFVPLSTAIPPGKTDCYSLNVCDAGFLYDGIDFVITAGGKSASAKLYGDYPYVAITRLMWTASGGNRYYPDGLVYYIDNKSTSETTINRIGFYDGTDEYYQHYWTRSEDKATVLNGTRVIAPNQPVCGKLLFSQPLAFREYLVEFNITNNGRTYSIIQKTKPLVNEFDISVGWADGDTALLPYVKAISSCHFNTVISGIGSVYESYPADFKKAYPLKSFFGGSTVYSFGPSGETADGIRPIDSVHAALPFGEPQLNDNADNFRVMGVYNKLVRYRNSCYPTTITLSHEPFFYRYAGLSDLNHYDAYRVVAPFSDAWYKYYDYAKEGKYGIYWGAPLETAGDYMRTLNALNYPNPVAAWTQGANSWNGARRFTEDPQYRYSPNPYELRVQAYENVANGAASLYWFNINTGDLLFYRDGGRETLYINRELCTAGNRLARQVPYYHARTDNYDLNLNMGTGCAFLYIIDLNYAAKGSMYQYKGMRENKTFSFAEPEYLKALDCVVKITKDGVSNMDTVLFEPGRLTFKDNVDMTGFYMLGDESLYNELADRYCGVIAGETFNIYEDGECYRELQTAAGFSDTRPYVPDVYKEQGTPAYILLYAAASLIIHPLEAAVTKLAVLCSAFLRLFR